MLVGSMASGGVNIACSLAFWLDGGLLFMLPKVCVEGDEEEKKVVDEDDVLIGVGKNNNC